MKSASCSVPRLVGDGLALQRGLHRAVQADRDRLGVTRNREGRLDLVAARGDQAALGVDLEGAVAAVGEGAVRLQHLEEAAALDQHVQRVVRSVAPMPWVKFFSVATTRTPVPVDRPVGLSVFCGGRTAGLRDVLVQQVLEHGPAALEARGVDVGEVVRHDGHARLLRVQSGLGYPQCFHGRFSWINRLREWPCVSRSCG